VSAELKGGRELERALVRLGENLAGEALLEALEAGAEPVVAEAKALVPVRTGKLRDSIAPRVKRRGRDPIVAVGAKAPHAHLIEFGHIQTDRFGSPIGHVAARPFLRPAVDAKADEVLKRVRERLGEAIERARRG
jgi:HK97 gp10 family phage protein